MQNLNLDTTSLVTFQSSDNSKALVVDGNIVVGTGVGSASITIASSSAVVEMQIVDETVRGVPYFFFFAFLL